MKQAAEEVDDLEQKLAQADSKLDLATLTSSNSVNEYRPDVTAEYQGWILLNDTELRQQLHAVIRGSQDAPKPEVLIRIAQAKVAVDEPLMVLAFEALAKANTELLLYQAWFLTLEERQQQAQEVWTRLFKAIRNGKARFAADNFAAWAKARAIDLYRTRMRTIEHSQLRAEPSEEHDPLDEIAAMGPRHEYQAILAHDLRKLPDKQREAFLQYHCLDMTQEEVAKHHDVTVRTVYTWLKRAETLLGMQGDQK